MVAYGFKSFFEPQIVAGIKGQTVRGNRKRHAHVGEDVQLYVAMRTKFCRKIIPDPKCVSVQHIVIESTDLIEPGIAYIEVEGTPLNRDDIEAFAIADGFGPEWVTGRCRYLTGSSARENMGAFWRYNHPELSRFDGALIKWRAGG